MPPGWESLPEQAPSIVREDQPTVARILAMVGVFLILLGLVPLFSPRMGITNPVVGPWTGFFSATTGLCLILFHAFVERERVFRRMYSGLGLFFIAVALLLRVWPGEAVRGWFPVLGFPSLVVGLVLLLATARLEGEKGWRTLLVNVLGGLGAAMTLIAVLVGLFARFPFLPGEGGIYLVLGLLYVGAYIGLQEPGSPAGYYAGLGLAAVGLLALAGAIVRSLLPDSLFFVPGGIILMAAGVFYLAVAAGVCLDWPIVVLTRRELASFFYSPIAYLVLLGMLAVGWYMFYQFLIMIVRYSLGDPRVPPVFEPIIASYIFEIIPVVVQMFVVPALTMRLVAEEQRTGTLEVLLTAPVNEATVVISKFLAAWFFFLLTWLPWWLFLIALRFMGAEEFDYRSILSFNVTLLAISAGFVSMGVFFSSLTRNQIIAAVLTFVGMIAHLAAYLIKYRARLGPGDALFEILTYVSYLDLWLNALEGVFAPRYLLFHISATVFFLYATIKVLESRKWK
jgi:hypothetical protein